MPVDAYCERTGPDFWSEPVNALTNVAFLVAAVVAYRQVARRGAPASVVALVVLLIAIGVGSFTFHTVATTWAAALDVGPILLFMLTYVVVFPRWFLGLPWRLAWLGAPAFVAFAALVNLVFGGGTYLPALVGMVVFAVLLYLRGLRAHATRFGVVAALFAVSLTLRTIDGPVCGGFPVGTHFAWHVCNAAVLYLLIRAAAERCWEVTSGISVAGTRYP
ncbi:ceramidase domain-containing protein [Actinokineospora iranica]|uniref:Ceramidase n=1 Tax=Actinokineospora iranica TaxID=1271860 RepID=A0A1G6KE94_9PSEU|nr:ceramidase domain-containing protein [Actinokineospora iranica]SDC29422.1 Ceramidase [Actinokineospora iranica]